MHLYVVRTQELRIFEAFYSVAQILFPDPEARLPQLPGRTDIFEHTNLFAVVSAYVDAAPSVKIQKMV